MPQADSIDTTNPPISRRAVEQQIDALIDLLDTLDDDPDLEPSLGFTERLHNISQSDPNYAANANAGDDREADDSDLEPSLGSVNPTIYGVQESWSAGNCDDREHEHDGAEPDADGEPSLGWPENTNQASRHFYGNSHHGVDMEAGVGPVRKKRPASKTGGAIFRGCGVLAGKAPPDPRDCGRFTMPMARPKRRASR